MVIFLILLCIISHFYFYPTNLPFYLPLQIGLSLYSSCNFCSLPAEQQNLPFSPKLLVSFDKYPEKLHVIKKLARLNFFQGATDSFSQNEPVCDPILTDDQVGIFLDGRVKILFIDFDGDFMF